MAHLVNAVLTNGARYYVDHAHPECSTPECADPRSVVVYDKAAELILQRSMQAVSLRPGDHRLQEQLGRQGQQLRLPRELPDGPAGAVRPDRGPRHAAISRQVFTGSGKVGSEVVGLTSDDVPFQITRADFFEEEVGLETTLKRPIVNTRDEPHADAQRYRRLHVIVGDANLSEVATFLKVGTTALVLSMIEDEFLPRDLTPAAPVAALRKVSYDLSLRQPIELADGTSMTAVEMQWEYLDRAKKYAEEHGLACIGAPSRRRVLRLWSTCSPASRPTP